MSILLPYQQAWVMDRSPVKVCVKSRRIGITWATGYEAVETAAPNDGDNFWYMTTAEDDAKQFIDDAAMWARVCETACQVDYTFGDEIEKYFVLAEGEKSVQITAIRFRSGKRIVALAHSPRKVRGKGGVLCLDEAAYHDNLPAVLEAAHAFRIWGGRLIFISTENGVEHPFHQMVEDCEAGRLNYSLHRYTLIDAVRQGLYRRVCERRKIEWRAEDETAWVEDFIRSPGGEQEYLCIPARSGGQYISTDLIEKSFQHSENCKIVRWTKPREWGLVLENVRRLETQAWLEANIQPIVYALNVLYPHFLGGDFGRFSDLSTITLGYLNQQTKLIVPLHIELGCIPFEQQKQIWEYIINNIPRHSFTCIDATGNGVYLGEYLFGKYGETLIEPVNITNEVYKETMPRMRARFEDGLVCLPRDLDIRQDLAVVQVIDGIPKIPKIRTAAVRSGDAKTHAEKRHGDAAVSIMMLCRAAVHSGMVYKYEKVERRGGHFRQRGAGVI